MTDRPTYSRHLLFFLVFLLCTTFYLLPTVTHAAGISRVYDLISDSRPSGTTTTHTIGFRVTTAIPVNGSFTIRPEGLTILAALDFTDIDLLVGAATTTLADRTLAAAPGVGVTGVSVTPGLSGVIRLTLGSDAGSAIAAGDYIEVRIGSNATFGGTGDQWIESPASTGSRRIRINTYDASNAELDSGSTLIAIVAPVSVSGLIRIIEPTLSNGLPTGLLPGGTTNVWISLNSDIAVTCRYATTAGNSYSAMLPSTTFSSANFGTLHYRNEAVVDNTIYNFFVRCQTPSLSANLSDYLINFEVGVVPSATATPPAPPPPPPTPTGGSSFSGGGGGGGPFLQGGDVTLEGSGIPQGTLVILRDGEIARETQVSVQGTFSEKFTNLQRGTYTWSVYVRDARNKVSATYNSTIYLVARTNNIIAPIYVSPTLSAASSTVEQGSDIILSGFAIPLKKVVVLMNMQGKAATGDIITASTTANGNGSWSLRIPTAGRDRGTYEIKAYSIISAKDQSMLSPIVYLGIGEEANPDFRNRSDLNKDGKVNLIDFSILLFNWNGANSTADINQDGTVNLVDFSIMLSNWTG